MIFTKTDKTLLDRAARIIHDQAVVEESTHGKPAADGPRYKALGNSMAVPVMRWIGERIAMVAEVA